MEAYPFSAGSMGSQMLTDNPDVLLRWNADETRLPTQGAGDPSAGGHFFQIGSDGGELSFFIQINGPSEAVICYDIESGAILDYAKDIQEYVERCRRVDAGSENLPNEGSDIPEPMKWLGCFGILLALILFGYGIFKLVCWFLK